MIGLGARNGAAIDCYVMWSAVVFMNRDHSIVFWEEPVKLVQVFLDIVI